MKFVTALFVLMSPLFKRIGMVCNGYSNLAKDIILYKCTLPSSDSGRFFHISSSLVSLAIWGS